MGITTSPLLRGLVVGEYGKVNSITLKNFSGAAENVSIYTGNKYVVRKSITCTASFLTDGSDGIVTWSFGSGDPLDRDGIWEAQAELNCSSSLAKSYPFDAEVKLELR